MAKLSGNYEVVFILDPNLSEEATAKLVGAHFLDAKDCEFNQVDGMHLTKKGHAQLAQLLARTVPGLLP